ncbi:MAG: response regulator, partial [Schwartzia sp.]|nr:response regulator [Schwartzia sp. (in: firmicutes)]
MARILLVDDDEISLMMTEMVLSEMHYDVTTAANGREAIALLQREPYDLLMLDIVMEDMSGIETLARIRKIEKISGIRTIFLTSSSHMPDMTEAIRLGALDFIHKPALPEKLYSAIRQALLIEKKDSILAVDDDKIILLAIQSLFGIRYDVRCVSSGAEALAEMEKEKPDLVLLDLHMPGMDGLEVMARLRCIEGCEDLPVVFLTGDNDADTEAKIFAAGAMDFLAKPMVMQVALHRIHRILENRHLQVSLRNEVELKIRAAQESRRRILNFSEQIIHALSGALDA